MATKRECLSENSSLMNLHPPLILLSSCSDDMEVAVAYYQYGIYPKNYQTEEDWQVRLTIERSRAIKCPPINYDFGTSKKVCPFSFTK